MDYDLKAKNWDNCRRAERAATVAKEIQKYALPQYRTALEFGCGTGLVGLSLKGLFDEIIMVDSSEGMIDALSDKISQNTATKITPLKTDLTSDPYIYDKHPDFVFSSMAYHHIDNIPDITTVLYSIIKNNGAICIVDLNKDDGSFHTNEPGFKGHNGFDHSFLYEIFLDAGFYDISINTFYNSVKTFDDFDIPYSLFCLHAVKKEPT